MASVFRRPRSPYWQAAYLDGAGRRYYRSTKQTRKSDAITAAAEMERRARKTVSAAGDEERQRILAIVEEAGSQAVRGTLNESTAREMVSRILEEATGRPLNNPTVEEWLNLWLEGKRKARSSGTYVRYETICRQFLSQLPTARRTAPISAIVPAEIHSFHQATIAGGRAEATANAAVKTLRAAFNAARHQGIVLTNPAEAIELAPTKPSQKDVFSPEQVATLAEAADGDWKTLILAGYYTGGRLGDLSRLTWEQLSLERATVTFEQRKTGQSVEIPLHPTLLTKLKRIPTRRRIGALFPSLSGRAVPGKTGLSQEFRDLMTSAGIQGTITEKTGSKGHDRSSLSFHSLRHSFNSAMANAGVSQEIRQKLTGHA